MDTTSYINKKFSEASIFLKDNIGYKVHYFESDIFKLFTKFGYVEVLTLDEAPNYLPSKGYDFSSIKEFTLGFITEEKYKIYAIRMSCHFNLFVVSYNNYNNPINYYSVTINDETLNICYILEIMTKNNIN